MRIYIPQYTEGKEFKNARGRIKEIINYQFTHLARPEKAHQEIGYF